PSSRWQLTQRRRLGANVGKLSRVAVSRACPRRIDAPNAPGGISRSLGGRSGTTSALDAAGAGPVAGAAAGVFAPPGGSDARHASADAASMLSHTVGRRN